MEQEMEKKATDVRPARREQKKNDAMKQREKNAKIEQALTGREDSCV